jgi:hypothetical protein
VPTAGVIWWCWPPSREKWTTALKHVGTSMSGTFGFCHAASMDADSDCEYGVQVPVFRSKDPHMGPATRGPGGGGAAVVAAAAAAAPPRSLLPPPDAAGRPSAASTREAEEPREAIATSAVGWQGMLLQARFVAFAAASEALSGESPRSAGTAMNG